MLTLEQVKALETKVERAVLVINTLRAENKQLKTGLHSANRRIAELEGLLHTFEQEQSRIEEGFKEALRKLDELEDNLYSGASVKQTNEQTSGKPSVSEASDREHQKTVEEQSETAYEQAQDTESDEFEELDSAEPQEKAHDQLF